MYYYTVCNIPLVTSLKQKHKFASNFVCMFLGWTPTKSVKLWCYAFLKWHYFSYIVHFLPILRFKLYVKNWSVTTTVPIGTFIKNKHWLT